MTGNVTPAANGRYENTPGFLFSSSRNRYLSVMVGAEDMSDIFFTTITFVLSVELLSDFSI